MIEFFLAPKAGYIRAGEYVSSWTVDSALPRRLEEVNRRLPLLAWERVSPSISASKPWHTVPTVRQIAAGFDRFVTQLVEPRRQWFAPSRAKMHASLASPDTLTLNGYSPVVTTTAPPVTTVIGSIT